MGSTGKLHALAIAVIAGCWPALPLRAQPADTAGGRGSTSFCLFEVPGDNGGSRRWINLGLVQQVEAGAKEVRIVYGGGNLGSGHEVRIAVANPDAALVLVQRMDRTAAGCR